MSSIYHKSTGIKESAAITANGNSGAVDVSDLDALVIRLDITAVTGTSPTLDLTIADSDDGTTFDTITTFTQKTATGNDIKRLGGSVNFRRFVRVAWVVGGASPSFTFSLVGFGKRSR